MVAAKTLEGADKMLKEQGKRWDCVLVGTSEKDKAAKMWKQRRGFKVLDDDDLIQSLILGRLE